MSEAAGEGSDANQPKSVKDKACAYCGQAFTSSSLGRHLDLYIRGKNPKPPDGIHDVVAIRKLRSSITRRQPRGSSATRTSGPTPSVTPKQGAKKATPASSQKPLPAAAAAAAAAGSSSSSSSSSSAAAAAAKNAQYPPAPAEARYPYAAPQWGAPPPPGYPYTPAPYEADRQPGGAQRIGSKQMVQKAQLDVKQRLSDAMDNARAAELALRELLGSWQAARHRIDTSTPFDFDPLALDFPALVLQCLQPPPTLFSSTQLHSSTSWAISSPGQREYSALQAHLLETFQQWKTTRAVPAVPAADDPSHPAGQGPPHDATDMARKAEQTAEKTEQQVAEHLQNAYRVWEKLAAPQRDELWVLELARSLGRKRKEADVMREQRDRLEQENANLKLQVDQLNRFQQPREFSILPPKNIPIDREILAYACADSARGGPRGAAAAPTAEDRNLDLTRVVANAIERWRNVIASTRVNSGGMNAQRPLDQPFAYHHHHSGAGAPAPQMSPGQPAPPSVAQTQQMMQQQQQQKQKQTLQQQQHRQEQQQHEQHQKQQQQQQQQQQKQPQKQLKNQQQKQPPPQPPLPEPESSSEKRLSTASSHGPPSDQTVASSAATGPPSGDETSDQDADAEMDDDDTFVGMGQPSAKPAASMQLDARSQQQQQQPPQQQQPQQQQQQQQRQQQQQGPPPAADLRFMVPNGSGGPANGRMAAMAAISRSMPGMNMGAMPGNAMHGTPDMSMTMQGVRGDIYME